MLSPQPIQGLVYVVISGIILQFCRSFRAVMVVVSVSFQFQGSKFTTAMSIASAAARIHVVVSGYVDQMLLLFYEP